MYRQFNLCYTDGNDEGLSIPNPLDWANVERLFFGQSFIDTMSFLPTPDGGHFMTCPSA